MDSKVATFKCLNDALLEAPIWEPKRGINWLAAISVDGTKPGGLQRRFFPHGRGECYYLVEQLGLFEAVEFGADRTAWSGNRVKQRWFGVVLEKTDTTIAIEQCESGSDAVLISHEKRLGIKRDPPVVYRDVPPSEEELQQWAEALQAAVNLMKPPKVSLGKTYMLQYLEAMRARDYGRAFVNLNQASFKKVQSREFYGALEVARKLILAPRPKVIVDAG